MPEASEKALAESRSRRAWRPGLVLKIAALAVIAASLGAGLWEVSTVTLGQNFHEVIPNRVYRCAQPAQEDLERAVRDHGIRTVINLRGSCKGMPWYEEECTATCRLDICQEDINFSAGRLPSSTELRRLVAILENTEFPVLLHCKRGADRTGLTAALIQLLLTDAPFEQGRGQLSLRFGHLAVGRTGNLDEFFTHYADWLKAAKLTHSRQVFRRWVLEEYRGGPCHAHLEWCSPARLEATKDRFQEIRIKATNCGSAPWHLKPSVAAGVHLGLLIWDDQDRQVAKDKFGHLQATVNPGETIELTAVVPPLKKAGTYRVMLDMLEEGHCWFYQAGSEPLEGELRVHE